MLGESRKFTSYKTEDKSNPVVDKAEADMQLMSKVKDKQPIEGDKEMLYDMLLKGVGLWDKEKLDNMLKEAGLWNKEMVLDSQKVLGEKLHVVELLNMDMIQELVLHMEGLIEHGLLLASGSKREIRVKDIKRFLGWGARKKF